MKKVLVVEDESFVRELCSRLLISQGYAVEEAENGLDACNKLTTAEYDVCLFDIRMPLMSGLEVYDWLNVNRPRMGQRVIFISGDVMAESTRSFLDKSGRPLLAKPFNAGELLSAVGKIASRKG